MRWATLSGLALAWAAMGDAQALEWRVQRLDTPARVTAVETIDHQVRIEAGQRWYALTSQDGRVALRLIAAAPEPKRPQGALPDARIVEGKRDIARAWLAEPTSRYDHGVLGDKIEAGSLVIETRRGKRHIVRLGKNAVFEDLVPRLVDLDGDGRDEIVVVKSYLKRGAALAVIAARKGGYAIVAETPPLGSAHRWLDPAGIGDFLGDGGTGILLVRQPHVVGQLELWSWRGGRLVKSRELPGFTNHIIGTRAIEMSAVADFDGDGIADVALPSLDRNRLRIISFAPRQSGPREIADIPLPAKAMTNLALIAGKGRPLIALGLEDGSLVIVAPVQ